MAWCLLPAAVNRVMRDVCYDVDCYTMNYLPWNHTAVPLHAGSCRRHGQCLLLCAAAALAHFDSQHVRAAAAARHMAAVVLWPLLLQCLHNMSPTDCAIIQHVT
jgi:hypothetical protein